MGVDEPTNHLDLKSIVALGDALTHKGTAFVVTHNRILVSSFRRPGSSRSPTKVDFRGTYDEFLTKRGSPPVAERNTSHRRASPERPR